VSETDKHPDPHPGPDDAATVDGIPTADDLLLIAVDHRRGRLRVSDHILPLGLAGGVLTELLLRQHISIAPHPERGLVLPTSVPPVDPLHAEVWDLIRLERANGHTHPLTKWIRFLAQTALATVAGRLAARGWLEIIPPTRRNRHTRYISPPPLRGYHQWRSLQLAQAISSAHHPATDPGHAEHLPQAATWPTPLLALAALTTSAGLTGCVFEDVEPARQATDVIADQLGRQPDLAAIVADVAELCDGRVRSGTRIRSAPHRRS
jgi:hypothetical protein